jgi:hypothetical protein
MDRATRSELVKTVEALQEKLNRYEAKLVRQIGQIVSVNWTSVAFLEIPQLHTRLRW